MRRSAIGLSLSLGLALSLAAPVASAVAQTRAELTVSRDLFQAGLAHAEAGRWREARAAFERALAISERPSILLNLATAQAETGALVESAASYRRFLEIATGADQAAHRPEAEAALAAVERRVAHLELDASGIAPSDVVLVDDAEVARGAALPAMNPGTHRVVVRRGTDAVFDQSVRLTEGASRTLVLRAPALPRVEPEPEPEPAVPITPPPPPPAPAGGDDGLVIGLGVGIGALVVGGVILGVVLGTSGASTYQGNVGDGVIRF